MIRFKNRRIDRSKPVQVYRNLRGKDKQKFSIRQNGLVVAHTDKILLVDCKFIVNHKGQARVRRQKRKNVHAYISGLIADSGMGTTADDCLNARISYNPYKDDQFMCMSLVAKPFPVREAACVIINEHGVTAAYLS